MYVVYTFKGPDIQINTASDKNPLQTHMRIFNSIH